MHTSPGRPHGTGVGELQSCPTYIYILFLYIYLFIYLFWCVGVCVLLASGQCHYYLSARFSVFPN